MGTYWSKADTWDSELNRIINLLEHKSTNHKGAMRMEELYATSPFIPIITNCLSKSLTYCIDTDKYVDTNPVILLIVTNNGEKIKKALTPLLKFLVTIKSKYATKARENFLNLDTNRAIGNAKNFTRKNLDLKIVSNGSEPIFNLCINFIKYGTNSEGIRNNIGIKLKDQILQLHGKFCFACNVKITDFECGHILSVAHGGLTIPDNLRPLCFTCNRKMSSMHMYEYIVKNGLPGIKNLSTKTKKLWKAIVTLTAEDPRWEKMPVNLRLALIGKSIITQY